MEGILIFILLPVFIFGTSIFGNFQNNLDFSENNSEIIAETEEKIFKNLKEEKDFYVYNYENISIKIKKSEIFEVWENPSVDSPSLYVWDKRNWNNFSFRLSEYKYSWWNNFEEMIFASINKLKTNFNLEVKREKVEKFWKKFQRLTYFAWWTTIQDYLLEFDEKKYINLKIVIFDGGKEFEKEIFEIFESIEFKK